MNHDIARIEELKLLKPARFPFLVGFSLEREITADASSDYSLRLRLAPREGQPKLELHFEGVRDLRMGNLEGAFAMVLTIRLIRADQMEGLAFKVQEDEQHAFSFVCSDFSSKLLEPE
jgi:hypothetical protein